ncbi:S8 family serine peptidase [Sphingomonas sp. SUN039]|uniref:S8 family peptidase n=1 Tax=Sphingomonas sp. SUN039 TaxID=2937787 RepID=UPI0021642B46|nr:S8 family serine peptidase [Sphingomonas sp. SUN039]UVO52814.1 S8 family serine peptidase [Sphingomonas sp. SUN039]
MAALNDQIARDGYAEVLVVLKPERRLGKGAKGAKLDLSGTRDIQAEAARECMPHFNRFGQSREVMIAREMRQQQKSMPRAVMASAPGDGGDTAEAEPPAPRARAARYFPNLGVMIGTVDAKGLQALAQSSTKVATVAAISDAELIRPQMSAALASDPPTGISWGIRALKADKLWDQGLTGDGVLVGHIDTGVDASHPALDGAVDAFAEFDRLGEQVVGATARDSGRHGTHTAGLIAGRTHSGSSFGVAPGATLASAMVIEGGKTATRLLGGLDWCVGQGIKVANISLGFRGFDPQFQDIIRILRERDILPVVAVGNEGPLTSRSPGNYRQSLSVGALDEFDQIWIDSSSIRFPAPNGYMKPDILGPGAEVWSSIPGGGMLSLSGTSMATPHISGLAALLWQHRPDATVAAIERAIFKSAKRPPSIASNRGNRGLPDAVAALNLLP